METLSLVWGILALIGMFVGFFPCLGALNWVNIPFAFIGLIITIVVYSKAEPQNRAAAGAGLVCCAVACIIGAIRLALGGGVF